VRVKWLAAAVTSLIAETEYVGREDPAAAARLEIAIKTAVEQLSNFPALGRAGRVPGTRELVVPGTPYLIPYRVRHKIVEIIRVFHGARKWPTKF
jgi:toxin ParE1/3/4